MSGVHGGRPDELAPATVSTKAIVYLTAMCANAPRARVSISRSFDWPHLTWLSTDRPDRPTDRGRVERMDS